MKPLLVLSFFVFLFTACSSDEPTCTTNKSAICSSAGSWKSCVDGDKSWYTWNGNKYECDQDGDCNAAALAMTTDIQAFCAP